MSAQKTHPLEVSLARLEPERDWLSARLGPPPRCWLRLDRLDLRPDGRLWRLVAERTGGADPLSLGLELVGTCAHALRLPVLLYARERRVVRLGPGQVAFLPYEDTSPTQVALDAEAFLCLPNDPCAWHPGATPVADESALRAALAAELEPLVHAIVGPIREATRLGRPAAYGGAASSLLIALAWEHHQRGDAQKGIEETELLADQSELFGRFRPGFSVVGTRRGPLLAVTQAVCCRAYRWPSGDGSKCVSCPLLPPDERIERQVALYVAGTDEPAGSSAEPA